MLDGEKTTPEEVELEPQTSQPDEAAGSASESVGA